MNDRPITATEVLASRAAHAAGLDSIGVVAALSIPAAVNLSRLLGIAERRDRALAAAYGRLRTPKARDTFMAGVDRSYRMRG